MDQGWLSESIRWYLVLAAVTWGCAPFARWLFGRLPDRGATVARPLALLVIVWPAWFLASVSPVPYTTTVLVSVLAVTTIVSWFLAWRAGWITSDWLTTLVAVESVSVLAFFGYVLLRGYTPEIIWTEKPMDIAFLTSSAVTSEIPPADPWYSGETINYYYLGYLIHGTIARIAGVPTWVAFNLALATTASMAVVAAGGTAFNIIRAMVNRGIALATGVLAAFLVVLAGNMRAPIEVLRNGAEAIDQGWWGTIGWSSSRIVIDTGSQQEQTINEFPWFSLLLGDLHPHLTALPFTILAIALAFTLLRSAPGEKLRPRDAPPLIASGAVVGALYPLNSLDFPTYLVVVLSALLISRGFTQRFLIEMAIVVASALIAWLPFLVTFVPFAGTDNTGLPSWLQDVPVVSRIFMLLRWHAGERTSVEEFLTVFGFFWVAVVVFLAWQAAASLQARSVPQSSIRLVIGGGLVLAVVAVIAQAPVVLLCGLPLAAALWLLTDARRSELLAVVAVDGLIAAGLSLIVFTEFFYVQDVFSGRYNTLFKVYYQVWTMLAIGAAVGIALTIKALRERVALQGVAVAVLAVGLVAAAAYPVVATLQWTRVQGTREWKGLDGLAFLESQYPDDVTAIRWLAGNAKHDDVILEAPGCSYEINGGMPTGRLAAFTGVPDIMGWQSHESQWRAGQTDLLNGISQRVADIGAMYADPTSALFDQYDVTLVVVGSFERFGSGERCPSGGPYPEVNDPAFPGAGWERVFESGMTSIYRRVA